MDKNKARRFMNNALLFANIIELASKTGRTVASKVGETPASATDRPNVINMKVFSAVKKQIEGASGTQPKITQAENRK